jgi:autotransporter-associated beta strand protein
VASTIFNVGLAIGEGNPYAQLLTDRSAGTASSIVTQMAGGIRFGGSPGEQGQTLYISSGNSYTHQINGGIDFSAATMEGAPAYNFIRTDVNATVLGKLTGGATFVKTGGSQIDFSNITGAGGINDNSGGIQLVQGTLLFRATGGAAVAFPTVNSVVTNGGIGSGTVTLNGGAMNFRYNIGTNGTAREKFWVGNNATGNSLIVNGASSIDVRRDSGSYTNKHLAFKDLTIGSSSLTVGASETYVLEINGGTSLVGTPLFNVNNELLLNGAVSDGGSGQAILKNGGGSLWLNSNASSFGGLYAGATSANGLGIVVNGGLLRFGDVGTENATAMNLDTMLRGSTIRINPNGGIFLTNPANINFGTGQVELLSSGSLMSLFRMSNSGFTQAYVQNALSSNSNGVIALQTSNANTFDLGLIGNGRSFLGATANSDYTAQTLGVGADNLYRIGGGGARVNFNSTAANNMGVFVENAPGTRVLYGTQAGNGNSGETDNFDLHTYTGGTIISRSSSLLVRTATSGANGPLGNGGTVDIFGQLRLYSGATMRNFAGTANQYTVNLHPGSVLWFDNEGGMQNRYDDATALNLNGGQLYLRAENNAATTTTEVIGAVGFSRGSSLRVDRRITNGAVQLTMADLTRAGVGSTLAIVTNGAFLGLNAGNDEVERIMVAAWNTTAPTLSGAVNRNGTPGFAQNGILPGYYIDTTSNTFLSYNSTSGFQSVLSTLTPATNQVAYSNIITTSPFTAGINAGTAVVDVNAAAAVTLQDNPFLYALRINRDINSSFGQFNTITFGGSGADVGGLIAHANNLAVNANLKYGATGANEGMIYNTVNLTVNGDISASAITKFGAGNLIIGKDQNDASRGTGNGFSGNWVVNGGTLTFNTLGGAGNGGTITLNASGITTGAGTTLTLNINPGSALLAQYSMGRIIAVDNAVVNIDTQTSDRTIGLNGLEIHSTDTTGLSPARLRMVVGRDRTIVKAGALSLTGAGNSILDIAQTSATNNQITSGNSTGVMVSGITGTNNLIKWGNGYLYVDGNNSATFTGDISIEQGVVGVLNANAFGNAGTDITARRYGVLDILTTGFTKVPTYEAGSAERWSVDNARSGAINLGAGSLQVNADQFLTNATVTLNGGAIEGFLRTDDLVSLNSGTLFRTLGAGVNFVFVGNSFVGQNALTDGPNGTDNGRPADNNPGSGQPDVNNNSALTDTARGIILEIKGNISGAGSLTKQSADTVILSGTNSYLGGTHIANGFLRLGSATALPNGTNVSTTARGVLDLGGWNASIGNLTTSLITGAAFSSSGGFITNSATEMKTLTVTPTDDGSYGGVIQNNINVTKSGTKKLVFTNANSYQGETTVSGGILEVTHVTGSAGSGVIDGIFGTSKLTVANGATFNLLTNTIGGTLTLAGTSGTVLELAGGSRLGVEVGPNLGTNAGSGAGENTGSSIRLNTDAKALVTGNVTVDAYFLPGIVTHAGKSDILVAQGGGLVNTNGSSGTYSVGNLYNVTNFTVTGITATDTLVQFDIATATALTAAYWKGGFTGAANVWAVSNGSTQSNWATDIGGTNTGLVPSIGTDVFVSATSNVNQDNMVLGADMSIKSLTVNTSNTTDAVVLQADGGHTLTIADAAAITIDSGASATTINSKLALSAATATITVNSASDKPLTLGGAVSGTAITKTGTGTLVLGGANTYTGLTTISDGILSAANDLALGATSGATTVTANGSLELQGNISIFGESLTLNGDGADVGADTSGGALRNLSGSNIYNGAVTLGSASTIQSDAGTLSINGGITGAFALTVEGAGNTAINGIIATGAGTLVKNDSGTLTLANANTYTGATTINGGTVIVSNASGLGTTAGATTVNSGGALNISGVTVGENVTINGTGVSSTGALVGTGIATVTGTVTMATSSSIGAGTGAVLTLGGVVSGTGMNLEKVGAGKVILSVDNTYTGTTTITGGTLQVGTGGTTGTISTAGAITNNGALVINRSNAFSTSQQITGSGSFEQAGTGTTTLSHINNNYTGSTAVSNGALYTSLNGTTAVTVGETSGTLANAATLGATGTVDGVVTVGSATSVGILTPGATSGVNGTLTITAASATALTVANGSQIQLSITSPTSGATVTFSNGQYEYKGGTYANALALFSSTADNDLLNGADGAEALATWNVAPAGTEHDFINLTGAGSNLTVGTRASAAYGDGSIRVIDSGLAGVSYGQVFNLIDWTQATAMNFSYTSGFIGGANPTAGNLDLVDISSFGLAWDTTAFGAYGILIVVPEPSRMLLMMFGLLGLFFRRRRRSSI